MLRGADALEQPVSGYSGQTNDHRRKHSHCDYPIKPAIKGNPFGLPARRAMAPLPRH
ncbi:hypothetical protein [Vreelandella titanicae]|uniref:hypothetical protein n=1 Tax=Vreelandella titanicae TaxID=664683 RepID=UPI001648DE55|nr:hypothetical protein [Halomonas titanicae]